MVAFFHCLCCGGAIGVKRKWHGDNCSEGEGTLNCGDSHGGKWSCQLKAM